MTKLEKNLKFPELIKIVTNNKTLIELLLFSPSRIFVGKDIYYPLQEIQDLFRYFNLTQEKYVISEDLLPELNFFNKKIEALKKIKNGDLTGIDLSNPPGFVGNLFDRQKPIVAQILLMQKQLLALEVGMGKTVISLFTALKLKQLMHIKVLIICEANQIHNTWVKTIMAFTTPEIQNGLVVIEGDIKERAQKIDNAYKENKWLWISSYETLRIEHQKLQKNWDVIILDEITKIKNISTKTSKVLQLFKSVYTIGLSGTPIVNSYFDLYGIMKIINPYVFTTKKSFVLNYLNLDFFGRPISLKKGAEEELKRKIFPWVIQQSKSDVNLEKPIIIKTLAVELNNLQKEKLNEILQAVENFEKNMLEVQTRLRQICNTVKLFPEYKDLPLEQTTNKLSVLKDLLENIIDKQHKKVVLFSFFKEVIELLKQEFENKYSVRIVTGEIKKGCRNLKEVDCFKCKYFYRCSSVKKYIFEFVEGDVQLLLGTDSLSRSHNLYTCDTLINFDLPWNDSDMTQRIGRIDRGEKNTAKEFYVYNLVTLGTVEEKIIKIIERKAKEQGKVFPKFSITMKTLSKTLIRLNNF